MAGAPAFCAATDVESAPAPDISMEVSFVGEPEGDELGKSTEKRSLSRCALRSFAFTAVAPFAPLPDAVEDAGVLLVGGVLIAVGDSTTETFSVEEAVKRDQSLKTNAGSASVGSSSVDALMCRCDGSDWLVKHQWCMASLLSVGSCDHRDAMGPSVTGIGFLGTARTGNSAAAATDPARATSRHSDVLSSNAALPD